MRQIKRRRRSGCAVPDFFFFFFNSFCFVHLLGWGTLRRIIGGGDAIPDAPFVLVTAKCKMGGGKSATFRERRRARETNGKRRRHLSASKGPEVVAWISSRAYFCIFQQQQTNGKRRRHLGASPCTSFPTVALLDFASFSLNCNFKGTAVLSSRRIF